MAVDAAAAHVVGAVRAADDRAAAPARDSGGDHAGAGRCYCAADSADAGTRPARRPVVLGQILDSGWEGRPMRAHSTTRPRPGHARSHSHAQCHVPHRVPRHVRCRAGCQVHCHPCRRHRCRHSCRHPRSGVLGPPCRSRWPRHQLRHGRDSILQSRRPAIDSRPVALGRDDGDVGVRSSTQG